MKKKNVVKMIIDILMLILIILEYSKIYTGQLLHEVFGIILFVLFIIHNILNLSFYKNLFKGKYNLIRIIITTVNICFLLCMILTITFGIPISNEVFKELNLNGNMTTRRLHMILGYWGMIFLSIHLGLHFKMIFAKLKANISKSKVLKTIMYIIEIVIIILGIKFMIDADLWKHLTGELSFGSYSANIFVSLIKNLISILSIGLIVSNVVNTINSNKQKE